MAREYHLKPAECFEFVWWRRVKGPGFRWIQDPKFGTLLAGRPNEDLRPYEPLVEETGLFLTFAHLDGSDDEFLRFANTYGRLGTYHTYYPEDHEPFYEWQRHHHWMHFLAQLRNEVFKNRPQLDKIVTWEGDEVVYRFPKVVAPGHENWRTRGELRQCPQSKKGLALFRPGDMRGPALWLLGYAIEDWFRELEGMRQPVAARMVWSERDGRPQFVFGPGTLLGAMVYQFAASLHGAWPFRECAYCHKFFRLAPGINRANRITCSTTCKQYLHNRRVERAGELHAKGRTVRQIVKELNVKPHGKRTSFDIVKAWIDRKQSHPTSGTDN